MSSYFRKLTLETPLTEDRIGTRGLRHTHPPTLTHAQYTAPASSLVLLPRPDQTSLPSQSSSGPPVSKAPSRFEGAILLSRPRELPPPFLSCAACFEEVWCAFEARVVAFEAFEPLSAPIFSSRTSLSKSAGLCKKALVSLVMGTAPAISAKVPVAPAGRPESSRTLR